MRFEKKTAIVTGSGGGAGNGQSVIVAPTVNSPVTEKNMALGGNIPVVDPSGLRYHAGLGFIGVPQA